MKMKTDNFKKHTTKNFLQRFLIDRFFDTFISELKALGPDSILDAGCGEGFTLERVRRAAIGTKLEGLDFLDRAIQLGKITHPELSLKQGNIYELPYEDNSFDVVLCLEVLEHLEYPERALKELQRVARKYCIVSVPNEPLFQMANFLRGKNLTRWGNDIEHIQHWSTSGIGKLVGKFFEVQKTRTPFPWTIVVSAKSAK